MLKELERDVEILGSKQSTNREQLSISPFIVFLVHIFFQNVYSSWVRTQKHYPGSYKTFGIAVHSVLLYSGEARVVKLE